MRPPLATVDELEAALGTSVDQAQAISLLGRASAIVRAFTGSTWLDEDGNLDDVPDDVPGVVVGMVERATRNETGEVGGSETIGPFTWSHSFGQEAAQKLYLTAMDKLVLRAAVGSTGLGVISTTRGPVETPAVTDYWDLPEEVIW